MPSSVPASPSKPAPSPSLPHGPLAHFLAHPDAWWKGLGHHLAHFANQVLPIAVPVVIAVLGLVTAWAVVRVLGRLRPPTGGQLVEVTMPAVVEAKGALAFWRNLHPVLAARRHLLRPTGHVAFEMEGSGDGIGLRLWVSADISAHAVARAVSSAWPGAQCQVRDAHRPNLAGPVASCGELRLAAPAWLPLGTEPPRPLGALPPDYRHAPGADGAKPSASSPAPPPPRPKPTRTVWDRCSSCRPRW